MCAEVASGPRSCSVAVGRERRAPEVETVTRPSLPTRPVALRPADDLVNEKEKYKGIADEMDTAFAELSGY